MISSELQEKLRRKFNPDGSDLRRLQLHQLEILLYVDRLCRRENIQYSISSGTAIGAVRHGGFIPWDDDLDIELPYSDYLRLLNAIKLDPNCPYDLQNHSTDPEYYWPFSKLRSRTMRIAENGTYDCRYRFHGAYIDIFPMLQPGPEWLHRWVKRIVAKCQWLRKIPNKYVRRGINGFLYWSAYSVLIPTVSLFCKPKGSLYGHLPGTPFTKLREISELFPPRDIEFEGKTVMGPANPDAYLQRLFGDYEKLPDDIGPGHLSAINADKPS